MLGAILLSWLLVFLGWNFGLKWWRNRGEEKPKKPIKRPGLVLGCGMLIFFVSSQVFWSEWFWTQASQLTTINLAGIGRWEESLWNALGKASIVKKLRLPIGGERSTEGGIAKEAPSDWAPTFPDGWVPVVEIAIGIPPLDDGDYLLVVERKTKLALGTVYAALSPDEPWEFHFSKNTASHGGTNLWTNSNRPSLNPMTRAWLLKRS